MRNQQYSQVEPCFVCMEINDKVFIELNGTVSGPLYLSI